MATLPTAANVTSSSATNDQVKSYWTSLLTFLGDLLGTDSGDKAAARTALGCNDAGNLTAGTVAAARLPTASDSTSGIVELATSAEVQTGTDTARAMTPAGFRAANVMAATAQTSTSGTSIDFTDIPSWVNRITVLFNGVSTNGTRAYIIQVGDAGGIETSGYVGSFGSSTFTNGFGFANPGLASAVVHGQVTLCRVTGNTWSAFGGVALSTSAAQGTLGGSKSLSATLDRVRITTAGGTDAFDAGQINIFYE